MPKEALFEHKKKEKTQMFFAALNCGFLIQLSHNPLNPEKKVKLFQSFIRQDIGREGGE